MSAQIPPEPRESCLVVGKDIDGYIEQIYLNTSAQTPGDWQSHIGADHALDFGNWEGVVKDAQASGLALAVVTDYRDLSRYNQMEYPK